MSFGNLTIQQTNIPAFYPVENPFTTLCNFLETDAIWNSGILTTGNVSDNLLFTPLFNVINPVDYNVPMVNNFSSFDLSASGISSTYTSVTNNKTVKSNSLKSVYNEKLSNLLANVAKETATNLNTKNWCAKGVNDALENAGFVKKNSTRVPSAYMLTSVYDKCSALKKVNVSRDELKNLPAGCIIVWQGNGKKDGSFGEHGHVCITLGNGKEASDNVRNLRVYDTEFTVYVPVNNSKIA